MQGLLAVEQGLHPADQIADGRAARLVAQVRGQVFQAVEDRRLQRLAFGERLAPFAGLGGRPHRAGPAPPAAFPWPAGRRARRARPPSRPGWSATNWRAASSMRAWRSARVAASPAVGGAGFLTTRGWRRGWSVGVGTGRRRLPNTSSLAVVGGAAQFLRGDDAHHQHARQGAAGAGDVVGIAGGHTEPRFAFVLADPARQAGCPRSVGTTGWPVATSWIDPRIGFIRRAAAQRDRRPGRSRRWPRRRGAAKPRGSAALPPRRSGWIKRTRGASSGLILNPTRV